MRFLLVPLFCLLALSGCGSLYPEYKPLIQQEITSADKETLVRELEARDPPSRLMFGMMVAKARCDSFWQELEQHRTAGDYAVANLQYIAKTISPVLAGPFNEKAVANTIWAIGLGAELLKSKNEIALLSVDKYRSALREKIEDKQRDYYNRNKGYAEELLRLGPSHPWSRFEADDVNYRIYSYARLCTRPEILMTFDQIVALSRVTPDDDTAGSGPKSGQPGTRSKTRTGGGAPSRSNELPGFTIVR
ncbi:MAG: hypothetical protein ABL908_15100 [Hyphomicrobium sp.]